MSSRECNKCKSQIGRANKSGFCQNCYLKRNDNSDGNDSSNSEVGNSLNSDCGLGLGSEILGNIPDLPTEWYEKDLKDLNAGHLYRILMCFFKPVKQELEPIKSKMKDMS